MKLIVIAIFLIVLPGCVGFVATSSGSNESAATSGQTGTAQQTDTATQAVQTTPASPVEGFPSDALLRENYQTAPLVLTVRIKQINIVDTLRDDNDKIGYVAFEVTGDVVSIYKAKNIQPGATVRYRFTQEYDSEWFQNWKAGEQALAFLTVAGQGILWVFGEAAHFHMTPELATRMETIAAGS
jgi:hypothetical protein